MRNKITKNNDERKSVPAPNDKELLNEATKKKQLYTDKNDKVYEKGRDHNDGPGEGGFYDKQTDTRKSREGDRENDSNEKGMAGGSPAKK